MSEASRTPETDAFANEPADEQTLPGIAREWADFARSLETQRDAALERERGLREALDWISKIALLNYEQDTKLRADGARTLKRIGERADAALAAKGEK